MIPPKLPKPNNPPSPIFVKPVLKPDEMKGRNVRVPLFSIGRKDRVLVGVVMLLPWTVAVAELFALTLTVTAPAPVPVLLAAVTKVVVEVEPPVS